MAVWCPIGNRVINQATVWLFPGSAAVALRSKSIAHAQLVGNFSALLYEAVLNPTCLYLLSNHFLACQRTRSYSCQCFYRSHLQPDHFAHRSLGGHTHRLHPGDALQINAVASTGGCSPNGAKTPQNDTLPLNTALPGALIGKLSEDGLFFVGSRKELKVVQLDAFTSA